MTSPSRITPVPTLFVAQRPQLNDPLPHVHWLSGGELSTLISASGGGFVQFENSLVNRWRPDRTRDADGYFIYLRDLDDGSFWSVGFQPTLREPEEYECLFFPDRAEFVRLDSGIISKMTVCLVLGKPFPMELRRCRLTNQSARTRRIELTSYIEMSLQESAAHESHPAFSKLFVETHFDPSSAALYVRRRPRQADERTTAAVHTVVSSRGIVGLQYESDRARFVGRGRSLHNPRALVEPHALSGTTGKVLDPIASLRSVVSVEPDETAEVTFVLGAHADRKALEKISIAMSDVSAVERAIESAAARGQRSRVSLEDQSRLQRELLSRLYGVEGERVKWNEDDPPSGIDSIEKPVAGLATRSTVRSPLGQIVPVRPAEHRGDTERLEFENQFGGFSADGCEYVIRLRANEKGELAFPPLPWTHVVANETMGFITSERGATCSWSGNSRLNRLTPWQNDPISDPHGEALYLRDEGRGIFWSLLPGPAPSGGDYTVRHGFGYTTCIHQSHGLIQNVTQFVPRHEPVKIMRVHIENQDQTARQLTLYAFHEWVLGSTRAESAQFVETKIDTDARTVWAMNRTRDIFSDHTAFAITVSNDAAGPSSRMTADRTEFLGRHGHPESPLAVTTGKPLSGRDGRDRDPCAAFQVALEVAPGGACEFVFLLGEAANKSVGRRLADKYADAEAVQLELLEVKEFWRQFVSAVQIETPSPAIDRMVNGWLPYQNLACRMWARSSYYQGGGAFGFRDQLQDASALLHHWPDLTRNQVLVHAGHQFVEGDAMHWWHPEHELGLRTRFSDDLLWLPLIACEYVESTGEPKFWDEQVGFKQARRLAAGEVEMLLAPDDAPETATLYEHCCRAVDQSLTKGQHDLPLMGSGDWNDGMNRIGVGGKGESVWLGFFLFDVLKKLLPVCESRGDEQRAAHYKAFLDELREALNRHGWDGAWYRRAFFDDGTPVGSVANEECQIDAVAQAWSVISRVAPPDRAEQAIDSVEQRLVSEKDGIIRLLTPPFDRMKHDPGYIKGYLPGVRENGGQYTHGVLWFVQALAEMGRGTRAVELLQMLSPISRTLTDLDIGVYQAEPYVVAADVYGQPPHIGRAGWTWYTGSAGWMFRVAVESILGVSLDRGRELVIAPSLSAHWPRCRVEYRLRDKKTVYVIVIENPNGKQQGVSRAWADGVVVEVCGGAARVPLEFDGRRHLVDVQL